MTDADKQHAGAIPGTGEEKYKAQQRKFWRWYLLAGLPLFALGILVGISHGEIIHAYLFESGAHAETLFPLWFYWGVASLTAIFMIWFTMAYFKRTDELDYQDNLIASTVGFYAYFLAITIWWSLESLNAAPPVNHLAIFIFAFTAALIAYAWRKWNLLRG